MKLSTESSSSSRPSAEDVLLPCPFCGAPGVQIDAGSATVRCSNPLRCDPCPTATDATDWNRRAPNPLRPYVTHTERCLSQPGHGCTCGLRAAIDKTVGQKGSPDAARYQFLRAQLQNGDPPIGLRVRMPDGKIYTFYSPELLDTKLDEFLAATVPEQVAAEDVPVSNSGTRNLRATGAEDVRPDVAGLVREIDKILDGTARPPSTARGMANLLTRCRSMIETLAGERDRFRAVLEGAEYEHIDDLLGKSIDFCRALGVMAATETRQLAEYRADAERKLDALLAHCPDAECHECSVIICPHKCDLHFHHDGCPACVERGVSTNDE